LTDSMGRIVNFRNTIILMTSNVGSDTLAEIVHTRFCADHRREQLRKGARTGFGGIQENFRPEFLNRLDD